MWATARGTQTAVAGMRPYTRTMGLVELVLRALAVTLISAGLLLPVADHHALERLPDAGASAPDAIGFLVHHHGPTGHLHQLPRGDGVTVLPADPAPAPAVDAAPVAQMIGGFWLSGLGSTRAIGSLEHAPRGQLLEPETGPPRL